MAVATFGNNIVGAFTGGVTVNAIYAGSTKVWPTGSGPSEYYFTWYSTTQALGQIYFHYDVSDTICINLWDVPSCIQSLTGFSYLESNGYGTLYFASRYAENRIKYMGPGLDPGPSEGVKSFYGDIESISRVMMKETANLATVSFSKCKNIGAEAFAVCSSLITADFQECEYIGSSAFFRCRSLITANFPECKHIDENAFYDCNSLSSFNFTKCEYIGSYAFRSCWNLTTDISLSMCSSINEGTFNGCSKIQSVNLPLCEYIGLIAFAGCTSLSSVSLPACRYLGNNCFERCSSLSIIDLPVCSYIGFIPQITNNLSYILRSSSVVEIGAVTSYNLYRLSILVPSSLYDAYMDRYISTALSSRFYPIPS